VKKNFIVDLFKKYTNESSFWTNYSKVYDTLNNLYGYKQLVEDVGCLLEKEAIIGQRKWLDIGCGTGNLFQYVLKNTKLNFDIIGLDKDIHSLKINRMKNPFTKLINADCSNPLPFVPNKFSIITVINTLYVFPYPQKKSLLIEIYNIMEDSGAMIISDPKPIFSRKRIAVDQIKSQGPLLTIFYNLLKIVFFDMIIGMNGELEKYHFLAENDFLKLLNNTGFSLKHFQTTYSDQNNLFVFRKKKQ